MKVLLMIVVFSVAYKRVVTKRSGTFTKNNDEMSDASPWGNGKFIPYDKGDLFAHV